MKYVQKIFKKILLKTKDNNNMNGNTTNYLQNNMLNHFLGTATYEKPTIYIGLFTVAPTEEDNGKELTGGAYCRKNVSFDFADDGATANASDIDFDEMPAVTTVAVGIFDSVIGGNMLLFGNLTEKKETDEGDTLQISKGDLDISID